MGADTPVAIPLIGGGEMLVDADDAAVLSRSTWKRRARACDRTSYAHQAGKRGGAPVHRIIMDAQPGETVDHINGDGLDNRRANLRLCSTKENTRNRRLHLNNSSGYKGVSQDARRLRAYIVVDGKYVALGSFSNPVSAARAYDAAALRHFGEFAKLNFDPKRDWLFVDDASRQTKRRAA